MSTQQEGQAEGGVRCSSSIHFTVYKAFANTASSEPHRQCRKGATHPKLQDSQLWHLNSLTRHVCNLRLI